MALPFHSEDFMDGAEAAAMVAAGVGVLAIGLIMPVGAWLLAVYGWPCAYVRPVLTGLALVLWLGTWWGLRQAWRGRAYAARKVLYVSVALLLTGWVLGTPLIASLWMGLRLP